ncbi:WD repeat-containing protein 25 [Rana temporaria]|uniref:WD repeat-containing protein 25 n=1 Tax=Rana temporaria TaxID=8407 RepID=UPI001AAD059C|nr:WD repeat-containing protein 25 [Rana temporaria]
MSSLVAYEESDSDADESRCTEATETSARKPESSEVSSNVPLHPSDVPLHPSNVSLHPSNFSLHPSDVSLHPSNFSLHPSYVRLHPSNVPLHPSNASNVPLHPSNIPLHLSNVSLHSSDIPLYPRNDPLYPSNVSLHPTNVTRRAPSSGGGPPPSGSGGNRSTQRFPANSLPTMDRKVNSSDIPSGNAGAVQQKRPPGGGVRPYIPKRLRQEQCSVTEGTHRDGAGPITVQSARSIYRASDYLGPHLPLKYTETEIPRNVVFQIKEHSDPVNRVQWCPVKQYSHLLLSASMDATVKVWDGVDSGKCLRTITSHRLAVRDAQWSACGQKILTGGFDSTLHITDVETGKDLLSANNEWKIGAVKFHPIDPNLFICAGSSPTVKAWDARMNKVIHVYKASVQHHFAVLFLPGGKEFVSTTDCVSRDSADRTIIAWDFGTAAKISNQIFHERYTCPSLALHPQESVFIAQTNGNYIALFSAQPPYKMNKRRRYEGHKVEGFSVGCEVSPDGSLIVTGSSDGSVYFYNYHTSKMIRSLPGDGTACVSVSCHPVLTSLLATAHWDGQIRVWQ